MVMTKPAQLDKKQALSLLNDFLRQFQTTCNQPNPPKSSDFERYLSRNFQISSNNHIVGKNLAEYLNRVAKFQKKYSHIELTDFNLEPLISGNKLIIQYDANLTSRNGQKIQMNFMVIITIEDNLITHWDQVAHEKGSSHWDS